MTTFQVIAIILGITAVLAVVNYRFFQLPESIGMMAMALFLSMGLLAFGHFFPAIIKPFLHTVKGFDFSYFVLEIALPFLIFAGAFGIDTRLLSRERVPVLVFATLGILISTFMVGILSFLILPMTGLEVPLKHCLLFGALISPTDPIAVLAILKQSGIGQDLEMDIEGESLLNDGVAVVVFLSLFSLSGGADIAGETPHPSQQGWIGVLTLFGREVLGGLGLGSLAGVMGRRSLKGNTPVMLDILTTLALVLVTYALAGAFHVSGPLAMVAMGLIMSYRMAETEKGATEQEPIVIFWNALDEIFNAVLFVLLGFVMLTLADDFTWSFLGAGLLMIPVVLIARAGSLLLTVPMTTLHGGSPHRNTVLLTWGGLRGGISVALALSLEPKMSGDLIAYLTYVIVVFSIIVQGLSIRTLVRRLGI
ncbi:MAG: sodium:proton antiporter [Verrucomicrobiae bacterium]|nr:sodium:proton antiporter [Verrucomicrobiae bacterium]